ncbi:MAG: RbsD/FucU family protein [Candidatus Hydrogenedentes bacterium]|nr:RbsD/FucU family protein [Candidatus Hydrogenedentota bacterium]
MLRQKLLHPHILEALAGAGHGSRVLITDANYPASTMLGENAQLVYLNLAPGLVTVIDVLKVLTSVIPVEEAAVMEPAEGPEPEIFEEFRALLPGVPIVGYDRFQFYEEASGADTCLQIVTGEQRIYANLLLTIGVVMP